MVAEVFLKKLVYAEQLLVLPLYNLTDSTSAASKTSIEKNIRSKLQELLLDTKNECFDFPPNK